MDLSQQSRSPKGSIPESTYQEVADQLSSVAKEYMCYLEDGRLLISNTHRFKPEVTSYIARLQRLNMPYELHYVEFSAIRQSYEQNSGRTAVLQVSDMQRHAIQIFEKGVSLRASDIHIRNSRQIGTSVLMRVNGDLEPIAEHPYDWGDKLCTTIYQAMSDISDATFEPLAHQDARISDRLPPGLDSIRVATSPQVDGYVMVMRLLYNDTVDDFDLSLLGYQPEQVSDIELMKQRPTGMNIIAGPTGSGKSTTLQRVLGSIIKETAGHKHIITVEDPPEYRIPGAVQTPVTNADSSEDRSRAFLSSIRAAMRLDPDIIMIGEIRDTPSARLALQASMTGHQVWTTLHANNAFAIIDRLLDLGIPLEMLTAPTILTGLTCQRLVRTLCAHCKISLSDALQRYPDSAIRRIESVLDISTLFVTGEGCEHCRQSGTAGRVVVAETIVIDQQLMIFIQARDRLSAVNYWRRELNGRSMLGNAIELVRQGRVDPFSAEMVIGPLNLELKHGGA